MHIRQRLNVDHLLILIPNSRIQGRAATGAMQSPWAALPSPGLGSTPRGAWGLPLLLSCQKEKRGWLSFLSAI